MNDGFLQVKNLNAEQLAQLEHEYQTELLPVRGDCDDAWKIWHGFFADKNTQTDWQYYWSYFRWYTDLTWRHFGQLDIEDMISLGFGRQVPMALTLDFDVWQDLMFYLNNLIDPQLIEATYTKVRVAFFASEAVVGVWQKNQITVADLVKDIKLTNQTNADSLRSAEILTKVKQIFTQNTNEQYAIAPPEVVVDKFVGLVNFFLGVEPADVWFVVDSFVNPEKYEQVSQDNKIEPVTASVSVVTANYADIKNMVEARFTRDGSGEFANLDGVLALLDSLATDQGNDQIRELYYFDEGAGKFQWNDALLT